MDFGTITTRPCENVLPPADPRCADPAFAIANPQICPAIPILIIKPGVALCCALGSIQFKAFTVLGTTETDVTDQAVFASSDLSIAIIGAGTGNATATGITAGVVTISASFQGQLAHAELTVLALPDNCCAGTEVAITVLVDNSFSMSQVFNANYATKLAFAKAAAMRFIGEVNGLKDLVGLDVFNSDTVLQLSAPIHNEAAVAALVPTINQTQSDTAFFNGLSQAIDDLNASGANLKVLLLISDGLATATEPSSPFTLLSDFKSQGGIVMCLGVRAGSIGFQTLEAFSTPGFFVNAYDAVATDALNFISGLKGYICAGNCTPAGDVIVHKGQLNYHDFINWDVVNGDSQLFACQADYSDPDLFFTVTTQLPHGFSSGQKVLVSGGQGGEFGIFNGIFTISVLNATQFTCPVPNQGSAFGQRGLACRSMANPGSVDLLGNGFFDLLPGNGLYVDLISGINSTPPFNGELVSKQSFLLNYGYHFRLTVSLAGNQIIDRPADNVAVQVYWLNGTEKVFLLNQVVSISDFKQGFTDYAFSFIANPTETLTGTVTSGRDMPHHRITGTLVTTQPHNASVGDQFTIANAFHPFFNGTWVVDTVIDAFTIFFVIDPNSVSLPAVTDTGVTVQVIPASPAAVAAYISIQQVDLPSDAPFAGVLLGEVKLESLDDLITLLDDNFDDENPQYVPPRCGFGTTYLSYGYAYGYNCYGTGCLDEPPPVQKPDPNQLPDIESGPAGPVVTTFTSTQTVSASCGTNSANLIGCTQSGQTSNCPGVEQVTLASGPDFNIPGNTFASVQYQLSNAQTAVAFQITQGGEAQAYSNLLFQGSNDGTNWDTLDTEGAHSFNAGQSLSFGVVNPNSYTFYKVAVSIPPGGVFDFLFKIYVTAPNQAEGTATATSTISQADADAKARAAALAIAQSMLTCTSFFTSTQSATAKCPFGTGGAPGEVTATATATSIVSQSDADNRARAAAETSASSQLVCNPDNNTDPVFIADGATAPLAGSPYPSFKKVSGLAGVVTNVTVVIKDYTHTFPSDVCLVLQGPDGTTCVLMAECGAGGGVPVTNITITFDDAAGSSLPHVGQVVGGTFKPTNYPPFADVPAPGPVSPYGQTLSVFDGKSPNGYWSLWACSEATGIDNGALGNGWDITITSA